jgi:hypothetical protein
MRKTALFVCGLLACLTSKAFSQDPASSALAQPASVTEATADAANEPPSSSPSNAPPAPPAQTPAEKPAPAAAPVTAAAAEPCPAADAGPKPWHLPQPCVLQNLGINLGGWLQQGITFNSRNPADGFNGPLTTNDFDSQYQMNQFWMYLVKPTKTDGCGFDIGGRIDAIYGSDWRFGQCFGLENRFVSPDDFYGLVFPQFYLEVAWNDLTVKLGHFATLTSYEVVPAPLNFFYSHSYLMAGYFDPLLVTGFQADYKLTDNWNLVGGFNRGWNQFEDRDDSWNFLGGVKWASDNKRASLSMMVDTGRQLGFIGTVNDRTSLITVFTYKISEKLQYASQYTVGREANGATVPPGTNADWYGMDQYLFYTINKKWSVGSRFEWVRDENGARIAGIGNLVGPNKGWLGPPGYTGSFTDLTFGFNYRPHPNCVLRPEIRWDWYGGAANPNPNRDGQPAPLPFDHFTSRSQFTGAVDLIVTF